MKEQQHNRRDFIKIAATASLLPSALGATTSEQGSSKDPTKGEAGWKRWDYVVYCYERGQGEWLFDSNTKGCFAPEREYMTFDEEDDLTWNPHYVSGWMNDGKLHFTSINEAIDFIEMHVRTKDDMNLIDSIYDIYYISREESKKVGGDWQETEIHVGHFWYNGDTGREVAWTSAKPYTNFNKVEFA